MGKKIIIVDDAAVIRYMLKKLFEKNGYEVVAECVNGTDAVTRYEIHKPDLVTMDITMPDMDGITAVSEIIKLDPSAKIIICSAMGQIDKVKDAVKAGAKHFLVKPLQPEKVMEVVHKIIGEATEATES